jgi:hypothetical protein
VGGWNSVSHLHHFAGHCHELVEASAWNDDRVPAAVRFLCDAHKATSFVLSVFYVEMLAFDLKLFRDNYVIHDDLEGMALKTI